MAKLYVEPLFKDKNRSSSVDAKKELRAPKEAHPLDTSKDSPRASIKEDSPAAFTNESPFSIEAFVRNLSEDDRARLQPTLEKLNKSLEAKDWEEALEITNLIEDLLDLGL